MHCGCGVGAWSPNPDPVRVGGVTSGPRHEGLRIPGRLGGRRRRQCAFRGRVLARRQGAAAFTLAGLHQSFELRLLFRRQDGLDLVPHGRDVLAHLLLALAHDLLDLLVLFRRQVDFTVKILQEVPAEKLWERIGQGGAARFTGSDGTRGSVRRRFLLAGRRRPPMTWLGAVGIVNEEAAGDHSSTENHKGGEYDFPVSHQVVLRS